MTNNTFACHGCGHCCRQMGTALRNAAQQPEPFQAELLAFPYAVTPSGACSQLQSDGGCAVYAERPLICRVDAFYDTYFADVLTRQDWHAGMSLGCPPKESPGL